MIIAPEVMTYPRPQLRRDSFFSLDGEWDYAITQTASAPDRYDGKIRVPYSPESPRSGVGRQLKKTEFLHYRVRFTLPEGFHRGRVLLHVGACDQVCTAFLNGRRLCTHEGGYLPFTCEIFPAEGENELSFVVTDDADSPIYGRGKQRYRRGGIWYTAISGIWQSVWLESVPKDYIERLALLPEGDRLRVSISPALPFCVKVFDGEKLLTAGEGKGELTLGVGECALWTPERPELYRLEIEAGEDRVESYFGRRSFSVTVREDKKLFALNGEPAFLSGLLDQGYWGEGIYTAESKEMLASLSKVKAAGYNLLRKHLKAEPLLWYYYCDILGILVFQDMLNGGEEYKKSRLNLGPFIDLKLNDGNYQSMGRADPRSRAQYRKEAKELMDVLYNCVSVCGYTPFNEGWGQFDAVKVTEELRAMDPSRLFDHASGWQDKGGGDFYSRHIYFRKVRLKGDGKRVLALTEFGGYAFSDPPRKSFGYRKIKSQKQYGRALEALYAELLPAIDEGLCAAVYTQLADVEDEANGIFTQAHREKLPLSFFAKLNEKLYCAFAAKFPPSSNS